MSRSSTVSCVFLRKEKVFAAIERNDRGTTFRFNIQENGYLEAKFVPKTDTQLVIELTLKHYAKANIKVCHHGLGQSTFHCQTLQRHIGHRSESMVEVRFAGEDGARMDYTGRIEIPENLRDVKVTQKNKNLILSEKVQIHTEPHMNIRSKDVECSHGAAIGCITPETLHYCLLRGIPEALAKDLLISGFLSFPFTPVLNRP